MFSSGDQQFALEWIQRHVSRMFIPYSTCHRGLKIVIFVWQILKFGGDPEQVTIWGQSAGLY